MSENYSQEGRAASFEEFYAQHIAPYKDVYLKSSRSANNKGAIAAVVLILTLAIFGVLIMTRSLGSLFFLPVILLVVSIYLYYDYHQSENKFNRFFKEKIIGSILDFLLPGATLDPQDYIDQKYYRESSLYRRVANFYTGNDLITAQYKGVSFNASEIASHKNNPDGPDEIIFKGVFMKATLSGIQGGTYIWPNNDLQLPRSLADEHFRLTALHEVYHVPTGAPAFDKYFSVYSSYPQEALAILTEERMQGMLNLRHQLKKGVRFSFVPGKFYATIKSKDELLEPVDTLDDTEYIRNYFYSILAYPAIINQLKLYEYI